MKISAPCAADCVQSASLPGRRSFRVADWRSISFSFLRRSRSSARSMLQSSSLLACVRRGGQPVVEGVAQRRVDDAGRLGRGQPVLGLADEFGLAHEHREHRRALHQHVLGGEVGGALVALELGVGAEAAEQGGAQALLVRAAFGGWNRVAVGIEEAVGERSRLIAHSTAPWLPGLPVWPEKMSSTMRCSPSMRAARKSRRPPGKWKLAFSGTSSLGELGVARPADFDAAEQIGLGARHLEQALRRELGLVAEDLRVGMEARGGAAAVLHLADLLHLAGRFAARIALPVEHPGRAPPRRSGRRSAH